MSDSVSSNEQFRERYVRQLREWCGQGGLTPFPLGLAQAIESFLTRTADEPEVARDSGILHDALVHIASNMWDGQGCAKFASERLKEYRASRPAQPPPDEHLYYNAECIGFEVLNNGMYALTVEVPPGTKLVIGDTWLVRPASTKPAALAKEPTHCGYCSYEESDGDLIEQCDKCKAADATKEGEV